MTVLLVGGIGRMQEHYERSAKAHGHRLIYCETAPLPRAQHTDGRRGAAVKIDAVVVIASHCAHNLREKAELLAGQLGVPIRYLRQPSASAVGQALGAVR